MILICYFKLPPACAIGASISIFDRINKSRGELAFLLTSWLAPLAKLISGVLIAVFLNPETLGEIQSVVIVLSYTGFLQLGVVSGLNRDLAVNLSNRPLADRLTSSSQLFVLYGGIVGGLIGLTIAIRCWLESGWSLATCTGISCALFLLLSPLAKHLGAVSRCKQQYMTAAKATGGVAIIDLATAIGVYFTGPISFISRFPLSSCYTIATLRRFIISFRQAPPSLANMIALGKTGFPIMLAGLAYIWFSIADRTYVVLRFDSEQIGFYSLASTVALAISVVPMSVGAMQYPKMASAYGQNSDASSLRHYIWTNLGIGLGVMLPATIGVALLLPWLVNSLLPKYQLAIDPCCMLLAGVNLFAVLGFTPIFQVVKRNLWLQLCYVGGLALTWIGGEIAYRMDAGLTGVASAKVIATLVTAIAITSLALIITRPSKSDIVDVGSIKRSSEL